MIKTYIKTGAVYRTSVIQVKVGTVETPVKFSGGMLNLSNPNCFFTTDDKELQKALETDKRFNSDDGYKLLSSEVEEKSEPTGKKVEEVKDLASAKAYILKNYKDYTQADVSTAEKVAAIAKKEEIYFPNWNTHNT
jgi:hypothetical protein